ncbi:histone deacetylase family protein [Enterovibrio paralichthyis]|uniref:histone deacetylase family protein n=1 Tax=Enterovibrio paralichthyis TaxID=2853805 RepID=UPI001C479ACA|nr:histone deacetylase family protein [Enterovibrio paralichthyis]MBV7299674.1 histone deacetylase family protein [Enterovibrio paralichthyis]
MKVIYSEKQNLHRVKYEFLSGEATPCFEKPERADMVLNAINANQGYEVIAPNEYGLEPMHWVHTEDYVTFLQNAWNEWEATYGPERDASPYCFVPARHLRNRVPKDIEGKLGYYSFDMTAAITKTSFEAIASAVDCALTGVDVLIDGDRAAFALCRPPGHHAAPDLMGGYCYINNAAIAAEGLRRKGHDKVAILDIDYHHGNGTQTIFYDRDDVLFVSIHGDPDYDYPHYLGFDDETGEGKGEGFNLNLPLPQGKTDWSLYRPALETALEKIRSFGADSLVISLGMDTYENDPISHFKLKLEDYLQIGTLIGGLGLPTLFVFEGGYAVDDLGHNTVAVLNGFKQAN